MNHPNDARVEHPRIPTIEFVPGLRTSVYEAVKQLAIVVGGRRAVVRVWRQALGLGIHVLLSCDCRLSVGSAAARAPAVPLNISIILDSYEM